VTASKAITAERLHGNKVIAGLPPEVLGPRGRYLTGLVEPGGALPRKCSFIYLLRKRESLWGRKERDRITSVDEEDSFCLEEKGNS
jgi:hypothetical protein